MQKRFEVRDLTDMLLSEAEVANNRAQQQQAVQEQQALQAELDAQSQNANMLQDLHKSYLDNLMQKYGVDVGANSGLQNAIFTQALGGLFDIGRQPL